VEERTAAFQQSEKTIRTIFETSYMNQGLLTTDGKVVYVNATSLATINRRLDDIVEQYFWETPWFSGTPGMPERVKDAISRVAAGESVQFAMPLHMPGGYRIYEFSMRPALDETGKVVALVPEAIDTTARVRAEQALQQTQKIEAIGNLTGGIAHDFNNLLMAVLGSLELLRKRMPQEANLLRLVDNAAEGARRGKSLTERMLSFARKQDLQPEHVSLDRLVNGMAELMVRALGPTITIDIQIAENLPQVEIDPNQLESALHNLAVNARDAMGGEGPLLISARECLHEEQYESLRQGRYVCLSVTDFGEGMDEQTLKRATSRSSLPKALARGPVLAFPWSTVWPNNQAARSSFKVRQGKARPPKSGYHPLVAANEGPTPSPSQAAASTPDKDGVPLSVLVVDDDPLVVENTAAMLEDLGHRVVAVASGELALQELKKAHFDLMLTDHAMPRMTGAQLIKETKGRYPQMAVMLATGFAELPQDSSAIVRLRKPYSQTDLADALAKVR
jgi:signal transduction histidine kinase